MPQRPTIRHWICSLALLLPQAQAGEYQSHDAIRAAAEHYIQQSELYPGEQMSVTAGRLDQRLRLSRCGQPLEPFVRNLRRNTPRLTVGVRCNDSPGWSLYVPVTVSVIKPVLVAASELPRGTVLRREHLLAQPHDIARLTRGYVADLEQVVGKQLKQRARANSPLRPSQIKEPLAVKRNSQVVILADVGSIQVRMSGKALDDGASGERIKVLNSSSNRKVEGVVVSPGVVRVTM